MSSKAIPTLLTDSECMASMPLGDAGISKAKKALVLKEAVE
jgi:hypothetical protein